MKKIVRLLAILVTVLVGQGTVAAQTPTATVDGAVTHRVTGDPLAGIEVLLISQNDTAQLDNLESPTAEPLRVVTDAAGRFTFPDLAAGEYVIHAEGEGLASHVGTGFSLTAGADKTLAIEMSPGGSIIGTVRDQANNPVVEGTVTLLLPPLPLESLPLRPDGSFLFPYVNPAAGYQVIVQTANTWAMSDFGVEVDEGESVTLTLVTQPGVALSGQVVSDMDGVLANATILLESPTFRWLVSTDANGLYKIGGSLANAAIPTGTYEVTYEAPEHISQTQPLEVQESGIYTQDVTLERASYIAGTVTDQNGLALQYAAISAIGATGPEFITITDEGGNYQLAVAESNEPFDVIAHTDNYEPQTRTGIDVTRAEVLPGIDYQLPPGTQIDGLLSIEEADVEPVATAEPAATQEPGTVDTLLSPLDTGTFVIDFYSDGNQLYTTLPGIDDEYHYEGLPAGEYVASVSSLDQQWGYITAVSLNNSPIQVDMVMQPTGQLTGILSGEAVVAVKFAHRVVAADFVPANTPFEIVGLAPAEYEVLIYRRGGTVETSSVTIESGAASELVIEGE